MLQPISTPTRILDSELAPGETVTNVAVAVFERNGEFLLASRPVGKPYANYWEFPGGKIEPSESVREALVRELHEELNVHIDHATPWFSFLMRYTHATVRLRCWRVHRWRGDMHGLEEQQFAWQTLDALAANELSVGTTLPGCVPIFASLLLPRTSVITNAAEMSVKAYLPHLRAFCGKNALNSPRNGQFDGTLHQRSDLLIQIRDKTLPINIREAFAREVIAIAREFGAAVVVNGDFSLAERIGADGIHLSSAELRSMTHRPAFRYVGASAHSREEIERAAELRCDYALLSPVKSTQTHPDAASLGWTRFAEFGCDTPVPLFALGGLNEADRSDAVAAGAHGIAMMRGILPHSNPPSN